MKVLKGILKEREGKERILGSEVEKKDIDIRRNVG